MFWNLIPAFRNSAIAALCLGSVGLSTGMPDQFESLKLQEVFGGLPNAKSMVMPDKAMLASLPPSAFDHTADGISALEMGVLLHAGESKNWKITDSKKDRLVIQSKHASASKVSVHALPMGEDAVLVIEIQEMQQILVETWLYNADDQTASQKQLLPDVPVHEFYSEEDQSVDLQNHNGNLIMWVAENGVINYGVRYWMEDNLADKQMAFGVSAIWDGTSFRIRKTEL